MASYQAKMRILLVVLLLAFWVGLLYAPPVRTSAEVSTDIKTLRVVMSSFKQPGHTNGNYPGKGEAIAPVNMRVIGSHFEVEALADDDLTEGHLVVYAEMSKNKLFGDSIINQGHAFVVVRNAIVDNQTVPTINGNMMDSNFVLFPAGYGMDLNAGDKVYINVNYENFMDYPHWAKATGTVYYVTR